MNVIEKLATYEDQISPGVSACVGCNVELTLRTCMKVLGPNTIFAVPPGCMGGVGVVGWDKESGAKTPVFFPLLDNVASMLAGIKMHYERIGRKVNVVAFAGDGASVDAGMQCLSGAAERGDDGVAGGAGPVGPACGGATTHRYAKSALALILPVIYCLLDALGTFADSRVLETLNEDSANCAYELTFLLAGIVCFIYVVLIRKQKLIARQEAPKYAGAAFETAGQFAYIYALADTEHVALAAPIISAYCVASVLWSRIFLKEKLSWKHYAMIALVVAGIVILGIYDA
mgnify:CR=1 FL=1